ncbi:MAG: zinc metalloprotease HtpX [Gammaproteobacteria bacterium]
MQQPTEAYQVKSTDWRRIIATNDRKTHLVFAAFFAIYIVLGLIIDLYLNPDLMVMPLPSALGQLLTFQVVPTATIVILIIAAISVLIAYSFYDSIVMMGTDYKKITPETSSSLEEKQLYNVVDELRLAAGLRFMPKVYLINAPYMNAFASGYSEKSALIAITNGLLEKLNRSELQAVMAHELSHIRHHDIKLTLAASIICNMILIIIDILFRGVIYGAAANSGQKSSRREGGDNGNILTIAIIILRFVLPILTMILMFFLSRSREYMADAGAVELMRDNSPLAHALLKIENDHKQNKEEFSKLYQNTAHEDVRRAAYIYDPVSAGIHPMQSISTLFSTHPNIAARLKALGFVSKDVKN